MSTEIRKDDCTPQEAVELIRTTPGNPTQIRPATVDLIDVLRSAPTDPTFDLESWQRQWSALEIELRSLTRANDVAEGR